MPKRSNSYQALIAELHAELGTEWCVEESALLIDCITGRPREVDVVLRASCADYHLCIAIECRDHGRPADVTWVESMAKKHESLQTSKLVLWSKSGFSQAAELKARVLNIDTRARTGITNIEWATLAKRLADAEIDTLNVELSSFIDARDHAGVAFRISQPNEVAAFDNQGGELLSVSGMLNLLKNHPLIINALLLKAPVGTGSFYAEIPCNERLSFIRQDGEKASVIRIGVLITICRTRSKFEAASILKNDRIVTLAIASIPGGIVRFLVNETPDGRKNVGKFSINEK